MREKPKDHIPLQLPEAERPAIEVEERETTHAPHERSGLEAIGRAHEGLDGKRYVTSFAIHIYELPTQLDAAPQFITLSQSADLTKLPEAIALHSLKELGRAIMKRYGRKPPRKLNDPVEAQDRTV